MIAAPVLTTQPSSLVVTAGQSATFGVTAASSVAATYQWSRGGSPIAGAVSAAYTLTVTQLADSGARFTVAVTNSGGTTTSAVARLTVNAAVTRVPTASRPFSDQSLWNARPTRFTLGTDVIPASYYYPTVADGQYSVTGNVAAATDAPMTVYGADSQGLWIADAESYVPQLVIPHWPANLVAASGGDGHADILDVAANKIHSFWQLRFVNGRWQAAQYTWSALDGRGWGTPAQYMQGSRAAGVPTIAGVIRVDELNDGLPAYRHALAMSMTYTGLAATPPFQFPATSADYDAVANSGKFPEGARLMIPASFDSSQIHNPVLLKIVETLKTFGAYVVDRNDGTPYIFYIENGTNFQLMANGGWDSAIAAELDLIRSSMRQIVDVTEWVDGAGNVYTPETNLNLMSLRGGWYVITGTDAGVFDSYQQAVVFPNNGQQTVQVNGSGRNLISMPYGVEQAGQLYRIHVTASGGAYFKLDLLASDGTNQNRYGSGVLTDGMDATFAWPTGSVYAVLTTASGPTGGGTVSATLLRAN